MADSESFEFDDDQPLKGETNERRRTTPKEFADELKRKRPKRDEIEDELEDSPLSPKRHYWCEEFGWSPLNVIGLCLLALGGAFVIVAIGKETTVGAVHNIGLIALQICLLLTGGFLGIIGAIFVTCQPTKRG
jgi:hypothetical protein